MQSTHYSEFLADIKKSIGSNKLVAADISIWGLDDWILGLLPWINVTMLNNGDFDYINTMSYHWSRFGNLWAWKKDAFFIDLWGINRSRVNLGIPYFSINKLRGYGKKIISHLIAEAKELKIKKISIETGSGKFFKSARKLFKNFGFEKCEPFSHYKADANSCYMTLEINSF